MLRRASPLFWLIALVLAFRLVSMAIVPFADTSEPRYAEMARMMATTGDWITPWFDVGVPFWGKPPLSFWSQALAIKLLGNSEFAIRLPAWLATLATLLIIFQLARRLFGQTTARWSLLIYSTSALVYVIAGAVLTDPFMVLGTTWIMAALLLGGRDQPWYWRYGVFLGMAIGLLAKGPLVLVLVGGSCAPAMLYREFRQRVLMLPWISGTLLTAALVLPWYIAAELKTPGFLNYFLVGEHILRFIDSGWAGDLYGSAHKRTHGTIWLFALAATFPWGFAAIWLIARTLSGNRIRNTLQPIKTDYRLGFLLGWIFFTPVFFTLAGNILWTYVLPSMPAFSVLAAHLAAKRPRRLSLLAVPVPAVILVAAVVVFLHPVLLSTEKPLIQFATQQNPNTPLTYIDTPPFSARYYSTGTVSHIDAGELDQWITSRVEPAFVAIPSRNKALQQRIKAAGGNAQYTSKHFQLYRITPEQIANDAPITNAIIPNGGS